MLHYPKLGISRVHKDMLFHFFLVSTTKDLNSFKYNTNWFPNSTILFMLVKPAQSTWFKSSSNLVTNILANEMTLVPCLDQSELGEEKQQANNPLNYVLLLIFADFYSTFSVFKLPPPVYLHFDQTRFANSCENPPWEYEQMRITKFSGSEPSQPQTLYSQLSLNKSLTRQHNLDYRLLVFSCGTRVKTFRNELKLQMISLHLSQLWIYFSVFVCMW